MYTLWGPVNAKCFQSELKERCMWTTYLEELQVLISNCLSSAVIFFFLLFNQGRSMNCLRIQLWGLHGSSASIAEASTEQVVFKAVVRQSVQTPSLLILVSFSK